MRVFGSPFLAQAAAALLFAGAVASGFAAGGSAEDYARAVSLGRRTADKIYRGDFTVRWLKDGRFTYEVQTGPRSRESVLVEPETGKVTRAATAKELGLDASEGIVIPKAGRSEVERIRVHFINRLLEPVELLWLAGGNQRESYGQLQPGEDREQSTFSGDGWVVLDAKGRELVKIEARAGMKPVEIRADAKPTTPPPQREEKPRNASPDARWSILFEDEQVVLRNEETGEKNALTHDGTTTDPYRGPAAWAPNSESFVVRRVREVPPRKVTIVESSPPDQVQPKVRTFDYQKPGDELPLPRPVLILLEDRKPRLIDPQLFPTPFAPEGALPITWSPGSDEFYFDYNQRGHQLYRILAVNARTAEARVVVEETSPTFIDYAAKTFRQWLPQTHELLWMSERDGWCHLWLFDVASGAVKQQVTRGPWVVREVLRVDETQRCVWFYASGLRAEEDPYHLHLCRVGLDGGGFRQLTESASNHAIEFSPDHRYFIDRWSRADQPPVAELRSSEEGKLVCPLERAQIDDLLAAGWAMPERFAAPGRDGKTAIYGVVYKPSNFDPDAKYPIVEEVYAGPQGAFAQKDFALRVRQHALTELGFIVVQADGMGTNFRGKAFHDVAWKNLQDAGFPDRIAWIKAAARTRPWMDLSRVGIYGGSAGGQNAMRALLDHANFYQAAFADCGCHDNRMDKLWWNEQWLGWPLDDSYVRASNVADAAKLRGALMLCYGELDSNVDPASTLQVVNALEKANKDFELLVITGSNHGSAETPYASRRRMDFFVRHLLGAEPRHP